MPWDPNAPGSTAQSDNQTTAPTATPVTSAARTTTGSSSAAYAGDADKVNLLASVTAVSGTTPSLTLSLSWSNNGTTWFTAEPNDVFTAITAAGNVAKQFSVKAPYYRVNWAITGTTPSFTFSVTATYDED